ncbi:MAG: GGDEF domain-containing protein [Epsilonproteobacteria bacterium]|nr:GGDEF domain-containing protein [Campylobacterota bacterium]
MRKSSLIPIGLALGYILLSILIYFYLSIESEQSRIRYLTREIDRLKAEFRALKYGYQRLAGFFYDRLVSDPLFLSRLERRRGLESYLRPYYTILQHYGITTIALLDQEGNPIVKLAPANAPPGAGELGIEFSKPIYMGSRPIGKLKVAIGYRTFVKELAKLFGGSYTYILKSEVIDKRAREHGNYLFVQSDLHPHYYYEEHAIGDREFQERIHAINLAIRSQVQERLDRGVNFALITQVEGTTFLVTFLALTDHKGHIGYLIAYRPDPIVSLFTKGFWQEFLLANLALLFFLLLLYLFWDSRYRLLQLATTDKLTGAYNRQRFYELADREIARSKRHGHPFSLILFSIDNLQEIAKHYGPGTQDYLLAAIAKLVRKHIRSYDLLFRWSEGEFVILAPQTESQGAMVIAEKIRKLVGKYPFKGIGEQVGLSFGVSQFYPQSDESIDEVMNRASNALYQSKREGGNRVSLVL